MRTLMVILASLVLVISPAADAAKKKTGKKKQEAEAAKALQEVFLVAKQSMAQGRRRPAIEALDRVKGIVKSKAELGELTEKRALYLDQFFTSDSFQRFQEARSLSEQQRWDECLREVDAVGAADQDNLSVLRMKSSCQMSLKLFDAAGKTNESILAVQPGDLSTLFSQVEIAIEQKQYARGLALLDSAEQAKASNDIERAVVLRAKMLEFSGKPEEAEVVLRKDQETHLDHVEVLYELGMLYTRLPGHDWPARKTLSLFITRCKRMKEAELKARRFDVMLPKAQSTLSGLDSKLGV